MQMDWLLKHIHITVEVSTFHRCFINEMREKMMGVVPLEERFKNKFGQI